VDIIFITQPPKKDGKFVGLAIDNDTQPELTEKTYQRMGKGRLGKKRNL